MAVENLDKNIKNQTLWHASLNGYFQRGEVQLMKAKFLLVSLLMFVDLDNTKLALILAIIVLVFRK